MTVKVFAMKVELLLKLMQCGIVTVVPNIITDRVLLKDGKI